MFDLRFDNAYVRELPGDPLQGRNPRQVESALYSRIVPEPVLKPQLLAWSEDAAQRLGIDRTGTDPALLADLLAGNRLLSGMEPFASNYGGHQFGHWAGQLGDGRAISLGEVIGADGARWELQLKGAGRTPYSRGADGRAVLRSSLREFLCSEAMHHLGVPTTRALSLVLTGERVERDLFYDGNPAMEPGAIVCRLAPSFIRFGHFELPASRADLALLRQLLDFVIRRDFPAIDANDPQVRYARWFQDVAARTAVLMAEWMRVGFVHGVMNTDNLSVLGLTIDYGPYGWIDDFDPDWTPNITDRHGRRYRFGQQPQIGFWNLQRLALAVAPLCDDHNALNDGLQLYADRFEAMDRQHAADKLGMAQRPDDGELQADWLTLLRDAELDMTLAYRALMSFDVRTPVEAFLASPRWRDACYDEARMASQRSKAADWFMRYAKRLGEDRLSTESRQQRMQSANPYIVPRNYLAQQAIAAAESGDPGLLHDLMRALQTPYEENDLTRRFAGRRPDWARHRPGCSMLSCSS
ncbi:MAG: YdiU family protein [Xanthomonadales bacterium]|nr:YdiU family protein [Xanthomonadales bacterium]